MRVLAALGVVAAFETGRGRAEDHHRAGIARANQGHIAALIARRLLLFIALIVLFVDDNQAQVAERAQKFPSASQ